MSPPPNEPRVEYQTRLDARRLALTREEREHHRLGDIRIAVFLATVAMFFAAFVGQRFSGWWLLIPVALLIVVGRGLQRLEVRIARRVRAAAFYERGLERLDGRWSGHGDDGAAFQNEAHIYAADLDVLGDGSLFQLLCVARTERGQQTLARWLLARAAPDAITVRQAAVRELAAQLDLREDLWATGDRAPSPGSADALVGWGEQPIRHEAVAARALSWMLSLLGLGAVISGITSLLARFGLTAIPEATISNLQTYFVTAGLICLITHLTSKRWTEPICEQVARAGHDLGLVAGLLERLEQERFTDPYLASLRATLIGDGVSASTRIAQLRRLVSLLNARRNEVMKVVGPLVLWDVQVARAIEDWRRSSGHEIGGWLAAVGEFETLASFAGFSHERPDGVFPEIADGPPTFDAEGLRHPLLPANRAVANNVALNAVQPVLIVSGSNMSGKSTLLRTIGISAVLAQAGAPVCATRLRLSPLAVGASIRIQDSLQDGTSRFYAEISRLSQIMTAARGPIPVLFLIDEFLHGTNSHDRLIGAEAVVRGLADLRAIGLITTHDLALTRLVETLGTRGTNVHFQDYLEEGRMRFDYRMRPGVVQHSNALALMRSVGLDV